MNNLDAVVEIYRLMKVVSRKGPAVEYGFKASEKMIPRESHSGGGRGGAERVATSRLLVCGGVVDRTNR